MLKIGNVEYDFSRVNVQDALEIKNAMFILAKENASLTQIKEANAIIDTIALRHLKVKQGNQWIDSVDENTIGQIFDNELAVIEISAQFMNRIKGFLEKLQSFQR